MCTSVMYENALKEFFLARTMDFTLPLDGNPIFMPSGHSFYTDKTKHFNSSLSFIGAGRLIDDYIFGDGVNEAGLAVASLYFAADAVYPKKSDEDILELAPHDVVAYLLGNCKNVLEVKKIIKEIKIVEEISPVIDGVLPLHWIVADKGGRSIVIEPVATGIEIYENSVGVMTNSPSFPWHLTNLNQYVNVTNTEKKPMQYKDFLATGNGAGSGMLGIPGDYTSISRFVRIAFMNQFIEKAQSTEESINVISRMLSAVYIPKGVKFKSNGLTDYTQFTSFMDLSNGTYYINFYENNRYLKLNIKKISETISTPKEFKVETTMIFETPQI